jgi:hypothetical protein
MNLGILFVGADHRVNYHNPAFNQIWLMPGEADLIGLSGQRPVLAQRLELVQPRSVSPDISARC